MTPAAHHSMDLWEPRRATSLKDARARTALVHILRLLFTIGAVLAAGILMGTLVQSIFRSETNPPPVASATMLNPRFEGLDASDRPYSLTAETARQRRENRKIIDLVNPRLEDWSATQVRAREGVFNDNEDVLDLVGEVVMTDAAGYTFTADRSRIFLRESRVDGQTPLTGYGPMGDVKADAYEVLDDGNLLVLKGNVSTRFTPRKARDQAGGGDR
jgi:lipopolysaccharide export system protein LptC